MALEADEAGSLFLLAAGATALTGRGLSSNYKDLPHSQAKRCHPQPDPAVVLSDGASRFVLMFRRLQPEGRTGETTNGHVVV